MVAEALRSIAIEHAAGRLEAARGALRTLCDGRVQEVGEHLSAGRLALELGLWRLGERELHLAVRDGGDTPEGVAALETLAAMYADLGEPGKETGVRERLLRSGSDGAGQRARLEQLASEPGWTATAPAAAPARSPQGLPAAAPADVARFLHLFQGREEVHARQWLGDGGRVGYSPIHEPLTGEHLKRHLAGDVTLGVYQVRTDQTVCFFALDLDAGKHAIERARRRREEARQLRRAIHDEGLRLYEALRELGLPVTFEDSGYKGRHLWGFFAEPLAVGLARNLLRALARAHAPESPDLTLELFPKQARVGRDQIGNLIKLPLGIHQKSGRRAWLLDGSGRPLADPWGHLHGVTRIERDVVLDVMSRLRDARPARSVARAGGPAPEPGPAEPPFTEADFEARAELRAVLGGCPVLATLARSGLTGRRLSHDEQIVLRHTLGHLPVGVAAVNYVFRRCPEVPAAMHLQTVLSGNPISCPRIRQRVPAVTATLPCMCAFERARDHYPTPLLHLDEARARGELTEGRQAATARAEPPPIDPETLARRVAHLREHTARLTRELADAERDLTRLLEALPDRRLKLPAGTWALDGTGAEARLTWSDGGETLS